MVVDKLVSKEQKTETIEFGKNRQKRTSITDDDPTCPDEPSPKKKKIQSSVIVSISKTLCCVEPAVRSRPSFSLLIN